MLVKKLKKMKSIKFGSKKEKLKTNTNSQGLDPKSKTIKLNGKNKKKKSKKSKGDDFFGEDSFFNDDIFEMAGLDKKSVKSNKSDNRSMKSKKSSKSMKSNRSNKSNKSIKSKKSSIFDKQSQNNISFSSSSSSESEGYNEAPSKYDLDKTLSSFSSESEIGVENDLDSIISDGIGGGNFNLNKQEMEEAEKSDLLSRFHILKSNGTKLSKNYTTRSSLNELRMEMGRIEHQHTTKRSVQKLRRYLLTFASGSQFVTNSKYAPKIVRGKLDGFSDHVLGSIEDYDSIFEDMSEKYGGKSGIGSTGNPIVDLGVMMLSQIFLFIFMNHKTPAKPLTVDEIKTMHPELVREAAVNLATEIVQQERAKDNIQMNQQLQFEREKMYKQPVANPIELLHENEIEMPTAFEIENGLKNLIVPEGNSIENQFRSIETAGSEIVVNNSELPEYEKLPQKPQENVKIIEMPEKSMSTRSGKKLKINEIPDFPPQKQVEKKIEKDGKVTLKI